MRPWSAAITTAVIAIVMLILYIWFTPPESLIHWIIYILGLIMIGIGSIKVVTDIL